MNTPTPTTHPTADMRAALHAGAGTNPLAKLRKLWTPSLNADHNAAVNIARRGAQTWAAVNLPDAA